MTKSWEARRETDRTVGGMGERERESGNKKSTCESEGVIHAERKGSREMARDRYKEKGEINVEPVGKIERDMLDCTESTREGEIMGERFS